MKKQTTHIGVLIRRGNSLLCIENKTRIGEKFKIPTFEFSGAKDIYSTASLGMRNLGVEVATDCLEEIATVFFPDSKTVYFIGHHHLGEGNMIWIKENILHECKKSLRQWLPPAMRGRKVTAKFDECGRADICIVPLIKRSMEILPIG